MREPEQATRVVRFGVFEVDFHTTELRKQGVRIRLPGQSFQVLEALLLRPGDLVTREELKQKLWPSDTFGDFEHGLNAAVNRVREALGDSSDNPRFVETLPRRGYRFIAPVEANGARNERRPFPEAYGYRSTERADPLPARTPEANLRRVPRPTLDSSGSLRAVAAGGGRDFSLHSPEKSAVVALARRGPGESSASLPLTTLPGQEILSVVFSRRKPGWLRLGRREQQRHATTFNVYVKAIGSEKVDQLTRAPRWVYRALLVAGRQHHRLRPPRRTEGGYLSMARAEAVAERKLADAAGNPSG